MQLHTQPREAGGADPFKQSPLRIPGDDTGCDLLRRVGELRRLESMDEDGPGVPDGTAVDRERSSDTATASSNRTPALAAGFESVRSKTSTASPQTLALTR